MKIPALVVLGAFISAGAVFSVAQAAGAQAVVVAQNTAIRKGKTRVSAAPVSGAETPAAVSAPAEELSVTELALANRVYTGIIPCDQGGDVTIAADKDNAGYFHVTAGDKRYHMRPVVSRTGAMRLEDRTAGAMWLQLGNKSMLLDQKLGRRLADDCVGTAQAEFVTQMKGKPQKNLFDPDPVKEAAPDADAGSLDE